ncbi:hypothetical protein AQUCO_01500032v1, partial [Aquilegia coerulea]
CFQQEQQQNFYQLSMVPNHVIEEILSRLPVKSITRFRCVCKSWCDLLSDRFFMDMHLNRSIERGAVNIFLRLFRPPYTIYSLDPEEPNHVVNLGFSKSFCKKIDSFIGSCNGLVCVLHHTRVVSIFKPSLPSTRQGTLILKKPLPCETVYGFFYNPVSCDYQLLCVGSDWEHDAKVVLYTFVKNSQKMIAEIPYDSVIPEAGILVNGAIHWLACRRIPKLLLPSKRVIVAFNCKSETFLEVPRPESENCFHSRHLTELAGYLSILRTNNTEFEVWSMKKYGIKESWTKLLVLPYSHPDYVESFYITKKGDLLLTILFGEGLFLYDQEHKSLNNIEIRKRYCSWYKQKD